MGQAKNRGGFEQRKESASPRLNLDALAHARHYAFILDKSPKGVEVIEQIKKGPAEIKARINSPAVELWEKSHFQFLVIWGTIGYSGGLTIPTLDMKNLLSQALPAVMQRTLEKGGFCSFIVGVAPDLAKTIEQRLAELQPVEGSDFQAH